MVRSSSMQCATSSKIRIKLCAFLLDFRFSFKHFMPVCRAMGWNRVCVCVVKAIQVKWFLPVSGGK